MGQFISKYLDDSSEKEAKAKEQLEIMMKLAEARLDTFQTELEMMFINPESEMKRSIPGKRALRFERSVRVDCGSQGAPGVSEAIDDFFNVGSQGGSAILDGFKKLVEVALKTILGDTTAGEAYSKKFFVCIQHNAIIRVDFFSYRYNFVNSGLIETHKNVFAYILCTSVVDHRVVTPDELVFLASEFAGDAMDGQHFEKYINDLLTIWEQLQKRGALHDFRAKLNRLVAAPDDQLEDMALALRI